MQADVPLGMRRIRPWPQQCDDGICTIAFEAIHSHVKNPIELLMPPGPGCWVEIVHKCSIAMPPFGNLAMVKKVIVLLALFVQGGVIID